MNTMTQPLSLGAMLAEAREERGISIEQAARETKIRLSRLKEMERDDISQFVHPSYARLFLRDYAKYLGISRATVEEYLPELGECSSEGMEYLEGYANEERLGASVQGAPVRRTSPLAVFGGTVLVVIAICGGLSAWSFHQKENALAKKSNPTIEQKTLKQNDKSYILVGVEDAAPISTSGKSSATVPSTENNALPEQKEQSSGPSAKGENPDKKAKEVASIGPVASNQSLPSAHPVIMDLHPQASASSTFSAAGVKGQ
ncbi:MAG: helix-turn-helix domain-containing protein [Chthoniobacterales bacterium]